MIKSSDIMNIVKWLSVGLLLFISVAGTVGALAGALAWMGHIGTSPVVMLPIIAIIGVVALLICLAAMSISFAAFNLADKTQALALPEGSVRAAIALSLVVLFAIISIFLFGSISDTELPWSESAGMTITAREEFLKTKQQDRFDVMIIPVASKAKDANGKDVEVMTFTVRYRARPDQFWQERQRAKDDFSKQLLILIGTLVTSVAGFYFGSRAAAPSAGADAVGTPVLASVTPGRVPLGTGKQAFEIAGTSLDLVREVKFLRGGEEVLATDVTSNAKAIKLQVALDSITTPGKWDIAATDASQRVAKLSGAVEFVPAPSGPPNPQNLVPSSASLSAWPTELRIEGAGLDQVEAVKLTPEVGPVVDAEITKKAPDALSFSVPPSRLSAGACSVGVFAAGGALSPRVLTLQIRS